MLILAITVLALLAVPLTGGRLSALATLKLRRQGLIALALLLQVLAVSILPHWPRPILVAAHVTSYLLAAGFLVANRHLPGIKLVALGGMLNAAAIAVNGGTLPASPSALRAVGITAEAGEFVNSGALEHPRLAFLGDIFASPSWLPLRNVYSIGDALILLGAIYVIHRTCRPRRSTPRVSDAVLALGRLHAALVGSRSPRQGGVHRRPQPPWLVSRLMGGSSPLSE